MNGKVITVNEDFSVEEAVESENPLLGIYASVTRKLPGEAEGAKWNEQQCMTIEEAIKSYTIQAAYAGFQEDKLGSIEPGKHADFTIIDKDLLSIDTKLIPSVKVMYTITGGRIVYSAAETGL